MPKYQVTGPDGGTYEVDAPDGASEQDAINYIRQRQTKQVSMPSPGASNAKGSVAGGIAMGLRDPVDAGAQLLRRIVPESVGRAVDSFGNTLADLGLPVARSSGVEGVDKIVRNANREYEDSRKAAGREGIDLARVGGNILNPVNRIVPLPPGLSTGANLARSGAQGAITSLATPVTEGDDFWKTKAGQVVLGGVTGAAGGYLGDKALNAADRGVAAVKRAVQPRGAVTSGALQRADDSLRAAAQQGGFDLADLPAGIVERARLQAGEALAGGRSMDPRALLRQAEAETVLGPNARLMTGQATRDPVQFAREMNLRGVQGAGEGITNRLAAQNEGLINALNTRGAAAAPGEMAAGQGLIGSLQAADDAARQNISGLYNQARSLNAREIPLDARQFADTALTGLENDMRIGFLPPQIRGIVNGVSTGDIPLNIGTAEQIKSTIAEATRAANRAGDGNTVRALSIVRDALEGARPADELGGEALAAFNAARAAARDRFANLEANPALRAAVDDVAPDKFFNKYVLASPARDLQRLVDAAPDQLATIRSQVLDHLKSKALTGASDEVGKFSQAGYNKALRQIGETKLRMLFPAEDIAQLRSIGNVASYIQAQPAGAAVNNSNTASAVMNLLSNLSGRVGSLPGVNIARNSIQQFGNERAAAQALSGEIPSTAVPNGTNFLRSKLAPLLGSGGLLGAYFAQ